MEIDVIRPEERLLTPKETAEYLGISAATLAKWRCLDAQSLPYVRTGRLIRYRIADVRAYLDSRTHGTTPSPRCTSDERQ